MYTIIPHDWWRFTMLKVIEVDKYWLSWVCWWCRLDMNMLIGDRAQLTLPTWQQPITVVPDAVLADICNPEITNLRPVGRHMSHHDVIIWCVLDDHRLVTTVMVYQIKQVDYGLWTNLTRLLLPWISGFPDIHLSGPINHLRYALLNSSIWDKGILSHLGSVYLLTNAKCLFQWKSLMERVGMGNIEFWSVFLGCPRLTLGVKWAPTNQ